MDQAYIQKLQNMAITDENEQESRYGRIMGKNDSTLPTYHQKQRSMGAIESIATEGSLPAAQVPTSDYKLYERNNIIASSKYATPKQVETLTTQKEVEENDVYVQCAKPQVSTSPSHSYGGSVQYPTSPRGGANYASPVYENINYYTTSKSSGPPYYHQTGMSNHSDGMYHKAQPQVPTGNKHFTSENEILPVYENIQGISHKTGSAIPGPQVAAGQAPPPYPTSYQNYPPSYQPIYSVMNSPKIPFTTCTKVAPQVHNSPSRNLTQQQLDEINASDYVCMTGSISQQFQTSTAKNYERAPATGIAGMPTSPQREIKKVSEKVEIRTQPPPSPTPSTASTTSSGKLKFCGKNLLPYSVTPPRPRGPTEAEKKIEEMTRQIEEEMEKHEEEGEYFGIYLLDLILIKSI